MYTDCSRLLNAAPVHPTKVLVIEALLWIDRPLSAADLEKVFDGTVDRSAISYHLKSLDTPEALEHA